MKIWCPNCDEEINYQYVKHEETTFGVESIIYQCPECKRKLRVEELEDEE